MTWMKTALLCLTMLVCGSGLPAAEVKPNVTLIMVDDFGYECVTLRPSAG